MGRIWVVSVFVLLILAGCGGKGHSSLPPTWITFQVDPPEAALFMGDPDHFYLSTAIAGETVMIRPAANGAAQFEFDGNTYSAGDWIPVTFDDLEPTTSKQLTARDINGNFPHSVTIWARPADFYDFNVVANGPTPGLTYLSVNQFVDGGSAPSFLLALDENGKLAFYRRQIGQMFNFNRFDIGGSIYQTYVDRDLGAGIILDENLREIDRVFLLPHNGSTWTEVDVHELLVLGPGHYVVPAYVPKQITNDPAHPGEIRNVIAAVFQEIDNGVVVAHWDSTEHPELYAFSSAGGSDYVHINSIEIDPNDGHFITSNRHLDAVMKIHRTTGEILWILGGLGDQFGLTLEQRISKIHDARMSPSGELTFFDNGNAFGRSRAVRMTIDEVAKTVTTFEGHEIDGHFSAFMGSTQFVASGTVLVGWGGRRATESDVTEWDVGSGSKRFEVWFNQNPGNVLSYRAKKYPALP